MRAALARIRLLEPLMLRGLGEFDPSSRGIYAYASSRYLPSPATVAGALISSFHPHPEGLSASSWQDLLELYCKAMDDIGVEAVRGFHICSEDNSECYVPLIMGFKRPELASYEVLKIIDAELLESAINCSRGGQCPEGFVGRLRELEGRLRASLLKPNVQGRVGIALTSRLRKSPSKTAREGYIYTAEYMSYPDIALEARFNLVLKDNTPIPLGRDFPLKLGGEHRITKVRVEKREDPITRKLEQLTRGDYKYILLTSPAPLDYEDLRKIQYIGRIGVTGMGYSLATKKRKPLYIALLEGTIIKIEKAGKNEEALKYGLYATLDLHDKEYRVLGRIGYATTIPIT